MKRCCKKTTAPDATTQESSANTSADTSASAELAGAFAALANPARIDILRHVALHRHCGCKDITQVVPLAQSTVSQHLKVLAQAGLIHVETVPPRSRYRVNEALLAELSETASTFLKSCCGCSGDSPCR